MLNQNHSLHISIFENKQLMFFSLHQMVTKKQVPNTIFFSFVAIKKKPLLLSNCDDNKIVVCMYLGF